MGVICAADPPAAWTKHAQGSIGVNVTEPLPGGAYYPEPTVTNTANGNMEAYGDLTETNAAQYFLDQPLESATTGASWAGAASSPIVADGMIQD